VTLPTFSDPTTTRSPTSTIVDLLWMVTKPGHPSVPRTAGSLQDGKRWRSLWSSVDGALVERMGLSMVRQLGLQSGVAMEVTGRCAEPSDCDRMVEADDPSQAPSPNRPTATSGNPDAKTRHYRTALDEWVPHLSSHDGPSWVQLKGFDPTGNRKVEGSRPSLGST
jgi:hypothetical protein